MVRGGCCKSFDHAIHCERRASPAESGGPASATGGYPHLPCAGDRNPRDPPPRRKHVEPAQPVHRLARRAAEREGPGRGRRRRAHDGRGRACASTSAHTSVLARAVVTHHLALEEMGQVWLPVQRHWRLNERHYGALQGLDKKETDRAPRRRADEAVAAQLRRAAAAGRCSTAPSIRSTTRATACCRPTCCRPRECLKDVVARVLPYWHDVVAPQLLAGQNVLDHRPRQLAARAW